MKLFLSKVIHNRYVRHSLYCLVPEFVSATCALTLSTPAVPDCCCSKRPAPYWPNLPFLIFDIRALWRSVLSARAPECQKLKMVGKTSMAKCKALTESAVKGLIHWRIVSTYMHIAHATALEVVGKKMDSFYLFTLFTTFVPWPLHRWSSSVFSNSVGGSNVSSMLRRLTPCP